MPKQPDSTAASPPESVQIEEVAPAASVAAVESEPPSVKEQFEKLVDSGDVAAIQELWRQNEGKALQVIDSYLEGSLALFEKGEEPSPAVIAKMFSKATVGARAADSAFGRTMFSDYVASFIGWTPEQQKQFRAGQKAFGEARKAAKVANHEEAYEAAQRCVDLAQPLGDWWGFAMGLSARGSAEVNLGKKEAAVASFAAARQIHHNLGLRTSAYRNACSMASLLVELDRMPRAEAVIRTTLPVAREFGDKPGEASLLELRAVIEENRGDIGSATATRNEAAALKTK